MEEHSQFLFHRAAGGNRQELGIPKEWHTLQRIEYIKAAHARNDGTVDEIYRGCCAQGCVMREPFGQGAWVGDISRRQWGSLQSLRKAQAGFSLMFSQSEASM